MQLLAKFKKILYMVFTATLNFRKFKVALNPMYYSLNFTPLGPITISKQGIYNMSMHSYITGWRIDGFSSFIYIQKCKLAFV